VVVAVFLESDDRADAELRMADADAQLDPGQRGLILVLICVRRRRRLAKA
jgi:hypothetical protein